ncbi:MAG: M15 family metallopeptidase [Candidatus Mcinerneyibacterium aminivorans]|uniref:M15 family metallopeptidase n=1 Tax=Candidatus Mcinerneyibacterium aminivorans TaxID=2703815 RepID=A0A5D0MDD9_9BACT|nr:MAG: M15 family metallopeptidase [Candidatus Mcinerneyibacterium aminivorans]
MKTKKIFFYIVVFFIFTYFRIYSFSLAESANIKNKYNITKEDILYIDKNLKNIDNRKFLKMLNFNTKLSESYKPKMLKQVPEKYTKDEKKVLIDYKVYEDLIKMIKAAKNEDINLKVISGYRSYLYQKKLYKKMCDKYDANYAKKYIAKPGYSQHQTGKAVDFNSLIIDQKNKKIFQWLKENAYKFGFSLSYPKDKNETSYQYEPWHYLHVGKDVSDIIHNIFGGNQKKFLLFINEYINQ